VKAKEARRIEEKYKSLLEEKQSLEDEITTQGKEEDKREKILTYHLRERTKDLNNLEEKFGRQERKLEEEIISLKTQLEEEKRTKKIMRIHMYKKEEDCEKLIEEVVLLRVEVEKLNKKLKNSPVLDIIGFGHIGETSYKQDPSHKKNVEETISPTQLVEEKYSRLPERKNEENLKSYAEVLKGRNLGQQESKKNDTFSRRPSPFRQKRRFNYDCD